MTYALAGFLVASLALAQQPLLGSDADEVRDAALGRRDDGSLGRGLGLPAQSRLGSRRGPRHFHSSRL